MDSKDPKMSPEKYAEMIREVKKKREVPQGRTIPEPVGKWLESRGIDVDTLLRLEPLLKKYETLSKEEKARFEELKDFEPNPGKATLNKVGETDDNNNYPIYQEDIDMLRKSLPLVKKLLEIQRRKSRLDDTSLLTGPDTTENIKEVYEIDDEGMRPAEKYTPGKDYIYAPLAGCLTPEEKEQYKKLFADMENYGDMTYIHTAKSDEKIRRAATGFTAEKQTEFPGAKHGEEWLRKQREEQIKDSGDVMFGVDLETQGLGGGQELMFRKEEDLVDLQHDTRGLETLRRKRPEVIIDDKPYPTTEEMKKHIDEQCNKNVSQDEDKIPQGYYKYSTILKRMDDTHTRKNNDYGDAAYQGYKKYGDFYFLVQLHNKMSRLESLTVNNRTQMVKDESIDDTLLDMANYAIMFLESRHRND